MAETFTRRGGHAQRTTSDRVAQASLPLIIVIYVLIFMLPIEFSVSLGSIFLPPTRLFFLITAVPLIVLLFMREKLTLVDGILAAYVIWVALAFLAKRGGGGIEPAGQAFIEIVVPYLMARLFLKDAALVARFIKITCILIALLGVLAIPEGILHFRYLHEFPRMLTGVIYEMQADERLGLLRSASTFENPILFGLYCATFLSLAWFSTFGLGTRILLCMGIILATALSLSSAPMLLLALQIALIVAERATRRFSARAAIIMGVITVVVVFLETFSNRGVAGLIAAKLTFNPHTGYYRLLQWEYSIDDVRANPLFGINFENWTRPYWLNDSIDNHWLYLAMNSGVPAVMLIFAALLVIGYRLYKRRKTLQDPILRSLMLGWIIGMAALFMGAWTVALFGKMLPVLFFMIGLGAALMQTSDIESAQDAPEAAPPDSARRFTRFAPKRVRADAAPPRPTGVVATRARSVANERRRRV